MRESKIVSVARAKANPLGLTLSHDFSAAVPVLSVNSFLIAHFGIRTSAAKVCDCHSRQSSGVNSLRGCDAFCCHDSTALCAGVLRSFPIDDAAITARQHSARLLVALFISGK